uniref:SMP-30/Gluconolactonase/LRE-like region domain-containing protein n=1 Tax=Salix viminalis TaxID=40686 RepID=A0A6N2NK52_SALVM
MCRNWFAFALVCFVLLSGFSSVSATPPAKILSAAVSNVVSALVKWLWSLTSNTKTVVSSRSMLKFEGGYTVETVFDGSKLGIEPYSVEVSPSGELLLLDSENSNIYKISTQLSKFGRPKLITGSFEGYPGHVDGKLRDARMNHPRGLTVDERGNIYVADTMNMAIRKISDGGVTTIAGGKWARGGGHVDGPSEDAKFSNDFDVVYSASSCSLLIIDRGSQAIREIHLHDDDCSYPQDGLCSSILVIAGLAVLVAAGFFGYMLALLQRRLQILFSSAHGVPQESRTQARKGTAKAPYQSPQMAGRPPFIPDEDEPVKSDEGVFGSLGRLILNTSSTVGEILGGVFSGFRRKPVRYQFEQHYQQPLNHPNTWPVQDSFVIPDEDEPPSIETRSPTPSQKAYPFMTKDMEQNHHSKQNQGFYSNWEGSYHQHHHQQQQQQQQMHLQRYKQQQQQQHRHYMPNPKTYYEKSCETNEIVFGAVQEQNGRREAVVIKAVDYGDPRYNHHNIRPRFNYVGYSDGYS